ncbi:MAG: hypothetical protein FJ288_02230 [Planctomycetes bacterium]|nr:hypothetical protein [Planctomycetota bacterium]
MLDLVSGDGLVSVGLCTLLLLWLVGAVARAGRRRRASLAIAERDREIEELRRALRERDQRLAAIQQGLQELEQEVLALAQRQTAAPGRLKLDRMGRLREEM